MVQLHKKLRFCRQKKLLDVQISMLFSASLLGSKPPLPRGEDSGEGEQSVQLYPPHPGPLPRRGEGSQD